MDSLYDLSRVPWEHMYTYTHKDKHTHTLAAGCPDWQVTLSHRNLAHLTV